MFSPQVVEEDLGTALISRTGVQGTLLCGFPQGSAIIATGKFNPDDCNCHRKTSSEFVLEIAKSLCSPTNWILPHWSCFTNSNSSARSEPAKLFKRILFRSVPGDEPDDADLDAPKIYEPIEDYDQLKERLNSLIHGHLQWGHPGCQDGPGLFQGQFGSIGLVHV